MAFDLNEAIRDFFGPPNRVSQTAPERRERYQEALISELLRSLVGVGCFTKDEAHAIIRRAKENLK